MRLLLYFFLFKGKKNYQTYSFKCIDKDGFIDKPCILLFCFVWQHRSFSFIFPLFSLFITQTFLYWQSPSSIRKCDCQLSYFGISCMKFQYSNKYSVQFDVIFIVREKCNRSFGKFRISNMFQFFSEISPHFSVAKTKTLNVCENSTGARFQLAESPATNLLIVYCKRTK